MMTARVYITLKPSVLDSQGTAVQHGLEQLGFRGLQEVRMGKYIEIQLNAKTTVQATRDVTRMCDKLLANPIIETYRFDIRRNRTRARTHPR